MIFIEEYAADKPRVLVLLPSLTTTEVLFLSDKAQIYPISEQVRDGLSGQISDLILNYSPDLHRGDVIFLPENPMDLALGTNGVPGENAKYQIILVSKLCALFSFKQVGMSQDGVIAFRLAAHGSDATNYCASVQAKKNQ